MDIYAQVGIGTTSPSASAQLEVTSSSKGFLPPRIALLSATDVATIATPASGLLIYNTATAGTSPNAVVPGYYYFNGTKWVAINSGGVAASLATGRTISTTGDVTYTSGALDGTANVTGAATLANSGVTAGTYGSASAIPAITVDAKGRITAVTTNAVSGGSSNKAYYYNTNNTVYINGVYQNGYNLATAAIIPFAGSALPTFSNGFTRVDNNTLKNTSGRTINIKVETSHFLWSSNVTSNTFNPQLYFVVNGAIQSQTYSGWAFQANNYGNVMTNSAIVTLNNNDTFSYYLAIGGGWVVSLKNNYINLIEL